MSNSSNKSNLGQISCILLPRSIMTDPTKSKDTTISFEGRTLPEKTELSKLLEKGRGDKQTTGKVLETQKVRDCGCRRGTRHD